MKKIIFFLILSLIEKFSLAQVKAPLAIEEYKPSRLNRVDEIRLFDLAEIKERKIDTVYIIRHPASWSEYYSQENPCNCTYSDTLSFYKFDTQGRIIQYNSFQQLGEFSTTFHYDTLGNLIATDMTRRVSGKKSTTTYPYPYSDSSNFKLITIKSKNGSDSLITDIIFHKFRHGLDTARIRRAVYNPKGQLIEIQSTPNKRNELELEDDTGEYTYHYKYEYDDLGRLIYYRSVTSNAYERISYPFYGRLIEIFNSNSDQIIDREIKTLNEQYGVLTVTFEGKQVILTPLEKGSKLYKLRTIVTSGEFPLMEYHEIIYK